MLRHVVGKLDSLVTDFCSCFPSFLTNMFVFLIDKVSNSLSRNPFRLVNHLPLLLVVHSNLDIMNLDIVNFEIVN